MVRIFVNHVDTYTGKVLSKVGCRKKKSEANDVKLHADLHKVYKPH